MKTMLLLLFCVSVMAGCRSSKSGCPGANTEGKKYKSSKFDWYKG